MNTFKSYDTVGVTTETIVYTGPAATQSTIIGLSVANTSGIATLASVKRGLAYIVKNAPIPSGGSLVVIGADQKVVIEATETISVIADNTVDVCTSVLEIS